MNIEKYVQKVYETNNFASCPFTEKEILELDKTNELLVYLPANISPSGLCNLFDIKTNINFKNEKLIKNVMINEDQWFITSSNNVPELIYQSSKEAKHFYEDKDLQGMDFRRYLAFVGTFKDKFGKLPDQKYWTFLLSGSYDKSGVSIVGFDGNNILSHHGWMRTFKSKFCGSRYVVLPPRIEINSETENLQRAYRR